MKAGTAPTTRPSSTLLQTFQESFSTHTKNCAIDAPGKSISYAQLDSWIHEIIKKIRPALRGQTIRIAVLSDQPLDYIPAMLACFRLGALYVPIDPKAPAQRLNQILEEVAPSILLLGNLEYEADIFSDYSMVRLPRYTGKISSEDPLPTLIEIPEDGPAYLFYTSGSTGKPKGIVGKLASLDHFINWESSAFGLDSNSRISQFTTPTFDAFLRDVLTPLSVGGTICIPPQRPTLMGAEALWNWIEEKEISLVHCVPSLFSALLEGSWSDRKLPALKNILLAGETIPLDHARAWISNFGNRIQLVNLYGSTETTMVKLYHRIQLSDIEEGFIPVGKPMPETEVFVLRDNGQTSKPGEVGEIHIATDHRTLGYFEQPEATAKVFKAINYTPILAYASGDLGTQLPDGNIRLFGRKDRQVKVGGVRIEPEEIEQALLKHQAIHACAVTTQETLGNTGNLIAKEAVQKAALPDGTAISLAAYLVLGEETSLSSIRELLADLLPTPAIPRSFFSIDKLPLNSNGKVDYRALKSAENSVPIRDCGYEPPATETEKTVISIWESILQFPGIGREDNFLSLGGDSLKAMQVANRLQKEIKRDIRITDLLKQPVLKNFCRIVDEREQTSNTPDEGRWGDLTNETGKQFPLTQAQNGLWFLWKMNPESAYYTCQGIIHLKGRYNPNALKEAWHVLLKRHDILRVRFANVSGNPVQSFVEETVAIAPLINLDHLAIDDAVQVIRDHAKKDAKTAFDLES
ncbi:MAG: AMP-binding protein, partial [Verrucomicrobia bacterium]|nr:AMP-binding protein [Verrucomicrobiota bacterium]